MDYGFGEPNKPNNKNKWKNGMNQQNDKNFTSQQLVKKIGATFSTNQIIFWSPAFSRAWHK